MDPTALALKAETEKWLVRLLQKQAPSTHKDKLVREQLVNVHAYIADCQHFLKKDDQIRAFEAIIYAWGIFETLERLHLIESAKD